MDAVPTPRIRCSDAVMIEFQLSNIEVVDVHSSDSLAVSIQSLDRSCFGDLECLNIREECDHPLGHVWAAVGVGSGELFGFVVAWLVADELHILTIAVDAGRRRCGVGRHLMDHAIRFAKHAGARLVLLEVRSGNLAATQLYRSLGFSRVRVRTGYYRDGEDAVEMMLSIG